MAKKYFEEHGNLNVNMNYTTPDGVRLGSWIIGQRDARRRNHLSEDQIRLLDAIGMSWDQHSNRWNTAYEYAKAYFDQHGTADVPADYKAEDGFALGAWVASQRNKYAAGKLKPGRMDHKSEVSVPQGSADG